MRFQLPDGQIIERTAAFTFGGLYYSPNPRRSAGELYAIGAVDVPEPPPPPDSRFYFVSGVGEPQPRPMPDIRRWMKKQVREQAREITNRVFKRFGKDVVYVLDKFVDVEADGKVLTDPQKTKMRDAVQRLRRLTRLDNDVTAREAAIDALADIPAAQAYVDALDVSEAGDEPDTDLV